MSSISVWEIIKLGKIKSTEAITDIVYEMKRIVSSLLETDKKS